MTKRLKLLLAIATVALAAPTPVWHAGDAMAQRRRRPTRPRTPPPQPQPAPEIEPEEVVPDLEIEVTPDTQPPIDIDPDTPPPPPVDLPAATPPAPRAEGERAASWEDVVVVVRKPFLKDGRLEVMPSWNITLNDNMIRHHAPTAQLSYWLTDVLAVGVEGQLFTHFGFLEPKDLVGRAYRRLPTLNEYVWAAALNFHYAPLYAKFAVFNKWVVHWEGMFTAGVGVLQSRVLPRDTNFQGWNNFLIAPNIGFQARIFVTRWITLNVGIKDYIFVDRFENVNRMTADVETAKQEATTQLINNIMFTAGFSFWLPTGFEYTTFR
jgi:outer membrane beta-barrel protein